MTGYNNFDIIRQMENEMQKGDLVRFNPTQYIFEKRLKSRSWYSGFYIYKIITLGRKWATLRMNCNNSLKRMPIDFWEDVAKDNDLAKIVDGKPIYINR